MTLRPVLCKLRAASLILMLASFLPLNAHAQGGDNESGFKD